MASTTTARTLERCRRYGWRAEKVEQWVSFVGKDEAPAKEPRKGPRGVRRDLFGFLDVLVLDGKPGLLGIQATGGRGDLAKHLAKLLQRPSDPTQLPRWHQLVETMHAWLSAGCRLELWSWRKVKRRDARGSKRDLWEPKILPVGMEMLREAALAGLQDGPGLQGSQDRAGEDFGQEATARHHCDETSA